MVLYSGKVGFAVGTGRCGTKFLARVISQEPGVSSVHERNPTNETFHRYCQWYQLPVDQEGFLRTKELEIAQDLEHNSFSFESSAHLSLSVQELFERFQPKIILLVRSPERVVNSYFQKEIFKDPIIRKDPDLAPGYQDLGPVHHFLGRIMPSGEAYNAWSSMSQIGKLSWWWNEINAAVLEQFQRIPQDHWRVEKLEEMDYSRYLKIAEFLDIEPKLKQSAYQQIAQRRPNSLPNVPTISGWEESEIKEFEDQVQPMAEELGYEYRVGRLKQPVMMAYPDRGKLPNIKSRFLKGLSRAALAVQKWSKQVLEKSQR